MPAFESITLSLPAHWITPVLYGDTDHLERGTHAFPQLIPLVEKHAHDG